MARVEQSEALSHKAKPIAFFFKATKVSETTKKTIRCEKREVFDWLLAAFDAFTLGFYIKLTQLTPILVQLLL
jgi:hypothetical protein